MWYNDVGQVIGKLYSNNFTYATMTRNSYEMALEVINGERGIKDTPL
jgi:hypothetical protein